MNLKVLNMLEKVNSEDIELEVITELTEEVASTLINKTISFRWHDGEEVSLIPGKVLKYENGKLTIFTSSIIFDETDDENNEFIKEINIEDIKDVYVLEKYNEEFDNLLDEDINEQEVYQINTLNGKSFECIILNYDSFNIDCIYIDNNNMICDIEYPLYLIESIKKKEERELYEKSKAELVTTFGRPSTGKTTLMISHINHLLEHGYKVMFISLEEGYDTISEKIIDGEASFIFAEPIKELTQLNEFIEDVMPDYLFIDYLELLPESVESIRYLRNLVNEYNINIYVNSQLSRDFMNETNKLLIREGLKDNVIYKLSDRNRIL